MKKILLSIIMLLVAFGLVGCSVGSGVEEGNYSVIMPTGAPSLALANYVKEKDENVSVDIVSGSDPLVGAFSKANYDIIVAPVNLGAKFYNSVDSFEYVLYKPIVGCNYYILSTEITSFNELNNKEMIAFAENGTSGVMLKSLIAHYDLNIDVTYQSAVNEANGLLVSGKAQHILTAEPSKTVISKNKNYHVISVAELWKEMAGSNYDVPQAGIFVKKSLAHKHDIIKILEQMEDSIALAYSNPTKLAEAAISVDANFAKQTVENLSVAIPNCNFLTHELNILEIEFYFQKVIDLGLGATLGGKLPDEGFYY